MYIPGMVQAVARMVEQRLVSNPSHITLTSHTSHFLALAYYYYQVSGI